QRDVTRATTRRTQRMGREPTTRETPFRRGSIFSARFRDRAFPFGQAGSAKKSSGAPSGVSRRRFFTRFESNGMYESPVKAARWREERGVARTSRRGGLPGGAAPRRRYVLELTGRRLSGPLAARAPRGAAVSRRNPVDRGANRRRARAVRSRLLF